MATAVTAKMPMPIFNSNILTSPGNFTGTIASGSEVMAEIGKSALTKSILDLPKPNNIGQGTWSATVTSQTAELTSDFGKAAKVAKGVGYASAGIDVSVGIYNNVKEGAPAIKTASDAVVDSTFGIGGVFVSAGTAAAACSIVPGIGTVGAAIAGFAGGLAYMFFTESKFFDGKSAKDIAKEANYNFVK